MSDEPRMLLIADAATGRAFGAEFGDEAVVCRTDAYDALEDMARRRWPAVVVSAPRAELAALCRASRRLQGEARLLALCPPSAEPDVRSLVPAALDDYFIDPPSAEDFAQLRRAAWGPPEGESSRAALSARQVAALIEAARTHRDLEEELASLVAGRLGVSVAWADGSDAGEPLLLIADDAPRILVPAEPAGELDESAQAFLADLRVIVPSLVSGTRRVESLHRLAVTDHLTGAYNRRYFYHLTDQILLRATRQNLRVSLLLYDIDDFKRYNDTYGHAAGDEILRETARMMRRMTRSQDIVARIGGDEFAVLFWDPDPPRSPDSAPLDDAADLADRFRQAVRTMEFGSLGPEAVGVLSISGGLARFSEGGRTCRQLLRTADQALRHAKQAGKNSVLLIGQRSPEPAE